jgi:hypothetical protein
MTTLVVVAVATGGGGRGCNNDNDDEEQEEEEEEEEDTTCRLAVIPTQHRGLVRVDDRRILKLTAILKHTVAVVLAPTTSLVLLTLTPPFTRSSFFLAHAALSAIAY